jgi:hypothetical protein
MIRAVWESPTNEGTNYYELGRKHRQIPKSMSKETNFEYLYEWECGRIIMEPSEIWGIDFGARIIVIDTEGKRRVSLPAATCAWEWLPPDDDEDLCDPPPHKGHDGEIADA